MEAQQWCEKTENKDEMAAIVGRRQWFNVPVPDIIGRIKGDINYGHGRIEKGTKLGMKFWGEGRNVLSLEESRHLVRHREHPLGQVRADDRHQSAGRQDEPLGSLARGRARRSASRTCRLPATAAASRNSSTARCSIRPTPRLPRVAIHQALCLSLDDRQRPSCRRNALKPQGATYRNRCWPFARPRSPQRVSDCRS